MKKYLLFFLFWSSQQHASISKDPLIIDAESAPEELMTLPCDPKVVIASKRIILENFLEAFNPSLLKIDEGFLLSFRYVPLKEESPHVSYIGVVILNNDLDPITEPQLLRTRQKNSKTPSQAEDARLFLYRGRIFLIYNDNLETVAPSYWDRRDMFLTELFYTNGNFTLSSPLKLSCLAKTTYWEKNWVPFLWNNTLLFSYSISPHEVLYSNLINGQCCPFYQSRDILNWHFGTIRGGTPAILIDGEYLAFFHSSMLARTEASWGWELWHYFMGAYTFSSQPPFTVQKMTPLPIIGKDFYTQSGYIKRVIFPGGFVDAGPHIYLAYGKDDYEIWIATLDKEELKKILKPINTAK